MSDFHAHPMRGNPLPLFEVWHPSQRRRNGPGLPGFEVFDFLRGGRGSLAAALTLHDIHGLLSGVVKLLAWKPDGRLLNRPIFRAPGLYAVLLPVGRCRFRQFGRSRGVRDRRGQVWRLQMPDHSLPHGFFSSISHFPNQSTQGGSHA